MEDTQCTPGDICNSIITLTKTIRETYKDSHVYVSSIPAREDVGRNNRAMQVNHLMRQRCPESVDFVDNKDVSLDDLEVEEHLPGDSKHVKRNSIRKIVTNFKNAIKNNVEKLNVGNSSQSGGISRKPHTRESLPMQNQAKQYTQPEQFERNQIQDAESVYRGATRNGYTGKNNE